MLAAQEFLGKIGKIHEKYEKILRYVTYLLWSSLNIAETGSRSGPKPAVYHYSYISDRRVQRSVAGTGRRRRCSISGTDSGTHTYTHTRPVALPGRPLVTRPWSDSVVLRHWMVALLDSRTDTFANCGSSITCVDYRAVCRIRSWPIWSRFVRLSVTMSEPTAVSCLLLKPIARAALSLVSQSWSSRMDDRSP